MASEELRRSKEENSFPNLLTRQPGFVELELIKINDEKTMSVQTWESEQHWWTALETVKKISTTSDNRENILVSRDFLNGKIEVHTTKNR
jgi:heme-degrading monooxygenase HmoA